MKTITRWGLASDISVSLIVLLALVSPAGAEVEVYSTDFEQTEGYALGDLHGQLGWEADEDPGDCVVQSSDRSSGSWAVRVTADGDYDGGFHEGAGHAFTHPSKTCNKLTVTLDTKITADDEADYLVTLLRKVTSEIVCYVHFSWRGWISVNGATTGSNWTANTWIPLRLELDFERQVADVFYGGKQVADDVAFAGTDPVDGIGIATDDYVDSGSSMLFDNLRITARDNPSISAITPTSGPKYTYMKIVGQDFGGSTGTVYFNGGTGMVSSWSDTAIYCCAPASVATGNVYVRTSEGFDSNAVNFTVTTPATIHVSNTTNVPGIENGTTTYPFSTVQRGIDAASDGAEVAVAQGTYVENINFNGKAITVRSTNPDVPAVVAATIIDGNQAGSVVTFDSGEGQDSILKGFTIQNGKNWDGGGIYGWGSSPTIEANVICDNAARGTGPDSWAGGGGIAFRNSSPTIRDNKIHGNTAEAVWAAGGGIYFGDGSSPTIEDNKIYDNTATATGDWNWAHGGGFYCWNSSPNIRNNVIQSNHAESFGFDSGAGGGGICCHDSSPEIRNNVICGNTIAGMGPGSGACGGGVQIGGSPPAVFQNNTIAHNSASGDEWTHSGGIHVDGCDLTITDCIVWENTDEWGCQIGYWMANVVINYCNVDMRSGDEAVEGGGGTLIWGEGNFSLDPYFANPAADDYHLKSQTGRWDPAANGGAGGWVTDAVTSPCIDAGDPASDYSNEPSANGGRINMGAYGNTTYASKSVPAPILATVLPDSGPPYTLMKVTGSWFSFAKGTVEVKGTPLNILAWSDTEVWCEVPPEATSGPLVVKRLNGVESNPLAFAVTDPTIIYVDDDNTSGIENGTTTYPFSTVQRAIRAATNGDTVEVAQGTYVENINFNGKAITVRSANPDDPAVVAATVLDGNHSGSVVVFSSGEGPDSVLKGFTIRNGSGADYCGAGVHCHGASPTVEKNVITGNTALAHGGGIYCSGGSPTIRDNRVEGNEARWFGGGIALWNSTATVTGNLIRDNAAHWYGGGLFAHGPAAPTVKNNVLTGNTGSEGAGIACLYKCSPLLENNTLTGNTAERYGGAVFGGWECSPVIRNTIAWANSAPEGPELAFWDSCQPTVAYSDIEGGQAPVYLGTGCSLTWGSGNLSLDPLMDASGYCHLKSTGGRYDRGTGAWVLDGVTSPCIDAGDPLSAYAAELLPNGDRINMGAWGNTAYASKPAGVGGLALGGTSAPADGAAAVGIEGEPADETGGQGGDEGEDQGTGGEAGTAVRPLVLVGPAPCLESTDPVLGGGLAGRTTLTLTFDRPVTVGGGPIEIYGAVTGAHNDYTLTYEDSKRTLRLKWASPLPADAYEVRLIAEFVLDDETGFPLDGEVQDPADPESLPSGNGTPGGDAHLEFEAE